MCLVEINVMQSNGEKEIDKPGGGEQAIQFGTGSLAVDVSVSDSGNKQVDI